MDKMRQMKHVAHLMMICAALLVFGSCGGDRSVLDSAVIAGSLLLSVITSALSVYYWRQKQILSEENRTLVRMLSGTAKPVGEPDADDGAALFHSIDGAIRSERLYANVALQRQDIIARFGLSRHALNDLITAHTGGMSFPQYINAIRMEETVTLLHERPDMTLTDIAAAVGFTPANLREKFKSQYGMTPTEYRRNP